MHDRELIDLARRVCFIMTLLERVEAGEPVPPSYAAVLARLPPSLLEFLTGLLTEPTPCMPPAGQTAAIPRSEAP